MSIPPEPERVNRTDLLGLASQLGVSPFANAVNLRFDYTGKTRYDGLNLQMERRFALLECSRWLHAGYARGNNSGAALAGNNFQLLAEKPRLE